MSQFVSEHRREHAIVALGALGLLIHAVNHWIADEKLDPAPTIITVIAVLVALLYCYLPWWISVPLLLFAGVTHTIGGLIHTVELFDSPAGGDYTGPVSMAGSLLLLYAAFLIVWRVIAQRRQSPDAVSAPT
jgi:hypothetical protein